VAPGKTVDKVITYTNEGDAAVTVAVSTQVQGEPAGLFTLSASSVTVPAHGKSTVTLTAAVDLAPLDQMLSGKVVATTPDGVQASTLIGIGREGERHNLTLNAKDRSGKPLGGDAVIIGKKIFAPLYIPEDGTSVRLPVGYYTIGMMADVEGVHGPQSLGAAVLTLLDIKLDQDRPATLDARKAKQLEATTPQVSTPNGIRVDTYRGFAPLDYTSLARWPNLSYDSVWVLPTAKAREGEFIAGARWRLEQPALTVASSSAVFDDALVRRSATPLPPGKQKVDAVFAGEGDAAAYKSLTARGKAAVVRRSDTVSRQNQAAAAVAAGAKLLLVVNDGLGRLEPWVDSIYAPVPAPITIATLTAENGNQLIADLSTGRRQTLTIDSNPTTEYLYDVSHFWDFVPVAPIFKVAQSSLARIDVSYRNYRAGSVREGRDDIWNGDTTSSLNVVGGAATGDRIDWVTAGVPWQAHTEVGHETQQMEPEYRSYPAGSRTALHWFGPVQRPRLSKDLSPLRQGGTFAAVAPGWSDSGGDHIGTAFRNADVRQQLSLYQGDALVTQVATDQLQVTGLKPERLPYRLVVEDSRGAWANPYSTSTRTAWGFTSAATNEISSTSLIQLDYAIDTDHSGKADRHAELTIAPKWSVDGSARGIHTPALDVSYDDGRTWHRAPLKNTTSGWSTRLDAPRSAGAVTLRTHAQDGAGNSIDQELTRAFGLR
jgi:hypothetical protein